MIPRALRGLVAIALTVSLFSFAAPSATAAGGDIADPSAGTTSSGFSVAVTFTGDAAPKGGGTVVVRVAAKCWWQTADGPFDSPADYVDYYHSVVGQLPWYAAAAYGPESQYLDAVASGKELQWWQAIDQRLDCISGQRGRRRHRNWGRGSRLFTPFAQGNL